jgi:hypothetical protein
MAITAWLLLDLERYAPSVRDYDVDAEVSLRLTAEDLYELGVASIGHRRRQLEVVVALTEEAPKPFSSLRKNGWPLACFLLTRAALRGNGCPW